MVSGLNETVGHPAGGGEWLGAVGKRTLIKRVRSEAFLDQSVEWTEGSGVSWAGGDTWTSSRVLGDTF